MCLVFASVRFTKLLTAELTELTAQITKMQMPVKGSRIYFCCGLAELTVRVELVLLQESAVNYGTPYEFGHSMRRRPLGGGAHGSIN